MIVFEDDERAWTSWWEDDILHVIVPYCNRCLDPIMHPISGHVCCSIEITEKWEKLLFGDKDDKRGNI